MHMWLAGDNRGHEPYASLYKATGQHNLKLVVPITATDWFEVPWRFSRGSINFQVRNSSQASKHR